MNRMELENKLIDEIHYLPIDFLEKLDDFINTIKSKKETHHSLISEFFNQFNVDIRNYTFDREEANER